MLWRIVVSIFHKLNTVKTSISFKKSKNLPVSSHPPLRDGFFQARGEREEADAPLPAAVREDGQIKKFERALSIKRDVKEGNMSSSLSLY
jgi:hypothetical protein